MSLIRAVADLLFPPRCQVCRQPGCFPLCLRCRREFRLIGPPVCQKCGQPVPRLSNAPFTCALCRGRALHFSRARAAGVYEGSLREAIHALKFGRCRALAVPLGAMMAEAAAVDRAMESATAIIPVPLHAGRLRERGFNQAELLASEVGRILRVPVLPTSLRRIVATTAQSTLPSKDRRLNVRGAFVATSPLPPESVLLVDDVISTGFTASACARELLGAGARRVFVLTVALSLPDRGHLPEYFSKQRGSRE